jgi:hypothetical protein
MVESVVLQQILTVGLAELVSHKMVVQAVLEEHLVVLEVAALVVVVTPTVLVVLHLVMAAVVAAQRSRVAQEVLVLMVVQLVLV